MSPQRRYPAPTRSGRIPAIKQCATEVHKAYPSDTITPPVNPTSAQAAANSTDTTFQSVIEACQYMALFAKIADAAGKHLTVASFTKAGYGLKNVTIPGSGGADLVRARSALRHRHGRRWSPTTPRPGSWCRRPPRRNEPAPPYGEIQLCMH